MEDIPCRRVANQRPHKTRKLDREGGKGFSSSEYEHFCHEVEHLHKVRALTLHDVQIIKEQCREYRIYHRKLLLHCCGVAYIAVLLARWREETDLVQAEALFAGLYHDLGKTCISSHLLYEMEWLWKRRRKFCLWIVKCHVWVGYCLLKLMPHRFAPICAHVALNHHAFQRHSYPSKHVYRFIKEPSTEQHAVADRILVYVSAADACIAILRGDPESRPQRIEKLKQDIPDFADLIDDIFREIITT